MNGVALEWISAEDDSQLAVDAAASFTRSAGNAPPPISSLIPNIVLSGALVVGELLSLVAHGPAAGSTWARDLVSNSLVPPTGIWGVFFLGAGGAAFFRNVGLLVNTSTDGD